MCSSLSMQLPPKSRRPDQQSVLPESEEDFLRFSPFFQYWAHMCMDVCLWYGRRWRRRPRHFTTSFRRRRFFALFLVGGLLLVGWSGKKIFAVWGYDPLSQLRIYESLRLSRLLFTLVPSRPSISVKVVFLSSYSIHPNARKREINECFEWALHSYLHVLWFEINFSFRSIRWRLPCFCFASYACMKWIQRVQDFSANSFLFVQPRICTTFVYKTLYILIQRVGYCGSWFNLDGWKICANRNYQKRKIFCTMEKMSIKNILNCEWVSEGKSGYLLMMNHSFISRADSPRAIDDGIP